MNALRIVTINTWKGDGAYGARVKALERQLRALRPDVVALQEAFAACDGSADTAAALAHELGMCLVVAPARRKARWCEGRELLSDSGLALLTRRPLLESLAVMLPSAAADGERIAQIGVLEHDRRRVIVVNLHLTHLRDAAALRRTQLACLLRHPALAEAAAARVLCGDFNAEWPEVAAALRETPRWRARDSYTSGGGGEPRATTGCQIPGARPGRCIDYIVSIARAANEHATFTSSRVVLNQRDPATGVYPSDHYGVATRLSFRDDGVPSSKLHIQGTKRRAMVR